jgi:hypothetical protein
MYYTYVRCRRWDVSIDKKWTAAQQELDHATRLIPFLTSESAGVGGGQGIMVWRRSSIVDWGYP